MFVTSFDKNSGWETGMLDAGAFYDLSWNFLPSADGTVRWTSLSLNIAPSIPQAGDFRFALGGSVGFINKLLSIGAIADMVRTQDGIGTGALMGNFNRENLRIVASIGFNFGGGDPPLAVQAMSKSQRSVTSVDTSSPPGYISW